MLDIIKKMFAVDAVAEPVSSERLIQLASAALLVEIALSDNHFDASEMTLIDKLLREEFMLSDEQAQSLINEARQEQDHASSIHQFTTHLNQHCDAVQKRDFVSQLWQLAYADGNIDKYEEYMIRRVADLLHLPHNDFIFAKKVAQSLRPH